MQCQFTYKNKVYFKHTSIYLTYNHVWDLKEYLNHIFSLFFYQNWIKYTQIKNSGYHEFVMASKKLHDGTFNLILWLLSKENLRQLLHSISNTLRKYLG